MNAFFILIISLMTFHGDHEQLIEKKSVSYQLSGNTSHNTRSVGLHRENGVIYFSFLSRNKKQQIYLYDYLHSGLIDSIPVYKIGVPLMGHKIITRDSILVYEYSNSNLFLINRDGRILNKYNLKNKYVDPKTWTPMPITVEKGNVFLAGYLFDRQTKYEQSPIVLRVNLENKEKKLLYHFPESYQKINWGGGLYYWIYYCYNVDTNQFIFSFPSQEKIFITDFISKDISAMFQSRYLEKPESYSFFKFRNPDNINSSKHFVENSSYKCILYDPFRKLYYRIGEFPKSFSGMLWQKEITIIVYNQNFEYITEKKIEQYYPNALYSLFVGPQGLHFQYYSSDNKISFKTLEIKLKEK